MNTVAIVGTLCAIFCLWMLRYAMRNLRKADMSDEWPSVPGRMIKVRLWGDRNVDGDMKPVEKLSVEFEYKVDGNRYSGTDISFYTLVYPETVEFAERHPEGSEVPVFYKPGDPTQSVLVTGSKGGNKRYSEIILAFLGLLVSVAIVAFDFI